jgi:nucleotide-binding universal stress UspA family protein
VGKVKVAGRPRTVMAVGEPATRILDCAKREKVDLIVQGSRGLSDLKGLLLDSVSHKASQLAGCPCVTAK